MDAVLLHSLLEANCSLAMAEELLLDSWGPLLDPEGKREAADGGNASSLPGALGAPRAPRAPSAQRPAPCVQWHTAPLATPLSFARLCPAARSLLLLQHDFGPDRDVLAPERGWSPRGETVPGVLQRHQVQHDP
jgi:hypothetical protein